MTDKDIAYAVELNRLSSKVYKLGLQMMDDEDGMYDLFYPDLIDMSLSLEIKSKWIFECIEELVEEGEFNVK